MKLKLRFMNKDVGASSISTASIHMVSEAHMRELYFSTQTARESLTATKVLAYGVASFLLHFDSAREFSDIF